LSEQPESHLAREDCVVRRHANTTGSRFHWLARSGSELEIRLDFRPELLIAGLTGRLSNRSARLLRSVLHDGWTQRPERALIDATALAHCDAAALAKLVEAVQETAAGPVAIVGLDPGQRAHLTRRFESGALLVRTFATMPEAVDAMMALPGAAPPDQATLLAEVRQLHRALVSRAAIDQAKGILMAVYGLDAEAAFALLAWHSRNNRVPLRELAARFVAEVRRRPGSRLTSVATDALLEDLASDLSTGRPN
jgi:AmiR/NasT family two-component response regulator